MKCQRGIKTKNCIKIYNQGTEPKRKELP